jgi:hypothetical protein
MPFRGQDHMRGWLFLNQKLGKHSRSLGGNVDSQDRGGLISVALFGVGDMPLRTA